jgi:hypothetical protein
MSSHGRSRLARAATLTVAAALSTTALATAVLVDLPNVAAVLEDAAGALGVWAYVLVAAFVFFETVAVVGCCRRARRRSPSRERRPRMARSSCCR